MRTSTTHFDPAQLSKEPKLVAHGWLYGVGEIRLRGLGKAKLRVECSSIKRDYEVFLAEQALAAQKALGVEIKEGNVAHPGKKGPVMVDGFTPANGGADDARSFARHATQHAAVYRIAMAGKHKGAWDEVDVGKSGEVDVSGYLAVRVYAHSSGGETVLPLIQWVHSGRNT